MLGTFGTLVFLLIIFGLAYLVRRCRRRRHNQAHRQGQHRLFPNRNSPSTLASELDGRSGCTSSLINSNNDYARIFGLTVTSPAETAAARYGRFSEPSSVVELPG